MDDNAIVNERKAAVLITGSSGLLGTAIARKLCRRYRVFGIDVQAPAALIAGLEWRECDLTSPGDVADVVGDIAQKAAGRLASVIHLAAYYDFSGEPSPLYEELTVEGTRRLLKTLREYEVEQFLFSSSILVMKPSPDGTPLDESSPLEAAWDYPASKIRAEEVVDSERGEIPAAILRVAGVYDEWCHSPPISQQIARIHQKKLESYFFPGDAQRGQAFVHLDDVAEAFDTAVEKRQELEPSEVFVIGEPDLLSYSTLQDMIGSALHDKGWPSLWVPKPLAKTGAWIKETLSGDDSEPFIKPWMIDLADAHYPLDITHARDTLAWSPRRRLLETLPRMLRHLKEDPATWYKENDIPLPDDVIAKETTGRAR